MFFLATVDESGQPSCSYKGGAPGFVRVVDPRTLAFPNYDGNGMFLSMGNIAQSRKVGMLFIDFERPRRMRLSGEARISNDDPLLADYPEAQFIVRVAVTQVFPNCPRYVHQYRLVERSTYVPKTGSTTPIPNWKKSDWACDRAAGKGPGAQLAVVSPGGALQRPTELRVRASCANRRSTRSGTHENACGRDPSARPTRAPRSRA
jgi:predicted pyridoxine 5'-phosphate oxidase superfamily flavin-nucleotide-binding protein